MKTLYLHLGYHKTGTTSIQDTLFLNSVFLEKNNYLYPKSLAKNHSIEIYNIFCSEAKNYKKKGLLSSQEQVLKNQEITNNLINEVQNSNSENIIISGEGIIFLNKNELNSFKYFIQKELNITNIVVILSVREILSLNNSAFQQRIKSGGHIFVGYNKFSQYIAKVIEVFGKDNLKVSSFETACSHKDGLVGYFCESISIPDKLISHLEIVKNNESISNKSLDLLQYIHKKTLVKGKYKKLFYSLRGEKFVLDQNIQEELLLSTKDDSKWLKEKFNIDYEDMKIKEVPKLIYDDFYYQDIASIYPKLPDNLKVLIYKYLEEKVSLFQDKTNQETLKKLLLFIETYKDKKKYNHASLKLIVLEAYSLGYKNIPKTACSSIKHALYTLKRGKGFYTEVSNMNIHQYWSNHKSDILKADFRFIVLRDPVKRFLSAYSNRVGHYKELSKEYLQTNVEGKKLLENINIPLNPSLQDFIKYLSEYYSIVSIKHHTRPIVDFKVRDLSVFTNVYKIENLASLEVDISNRYNTEFTLPRLQTGGLKYKVSDLSKDELDFLFDFYKEDYALISEYYTKEMILEEWKN
jgi:hypothetical protein